MESATRTIGRRSAEKNEDELIRISDSQGRWIGLPAVAPKEWRIRFDDGALELRLHRNPRMILGSVRLLGVALAFILAVLFGFWLFGDRLPGLSKNDESRVYQVYKDFYSSCFIAVVLERSQDQDRMWDEAARENGFRNASHFREWAKENLEPDENAEAAKRAQEWYVPLVRQWTEIKTVEAARRDVMR
ncbi:MAG: hypothetical protein ACYTFG_01590 [Planctomycetota bacterium]